MQAPIRTIYVPFDGRNTVAVSTDHGYATTLAILLDAGACPENSHSTPNPLQLAILHGEPLCLARLLRAGADPSMAYPSRPSGLVQEMKPIWSKSAPPGSVVWQMHSITYRTDAYTASSW